MTERWQREVRKLGELEPGRQVWERALHGSRLPESRPPSKRWLAAAVAAVAFLGVAGTVAWLASAPPHQGAGLFPTERPTPIPTTARVICTDDGARALTPAVRAGREGFVVRFENRSGAKEFFVVDPDYNTGTEGYVGHGGRLPAGRKDVRMYDDPGRVYVGCFGAGQRPLDVHDPAYATFRVVDPQGWWVPGELDCANSYRTTVRRRGSASDLEAIVRTIDGVRESDVVQRPGYPGTPWKAEPRIVVRKGRVVAHVTLLGPLEGHGRFKVWADACPGSGIGSDR